MSTLLLVALALFPLPQADPTYAVVDVTVMGADGGEILTHQTVVIAGDVITAVGPTAEVPVPGSATTIDGTGRTLLPGLIDAHGHVEDSGDLALYLAHGVTALRNVRGRPVHLDLRDAIERDERTGPRLVVGAPPLVGRTTAEDARRAVAVAKWANYDFVEVPRELRLATWRTLLSEAERVGLPVAGAAPTGIGLDRVLAERPYPIADAESLLGPYLAEPRRPLDAARVPSIVAAVRAAGVSVTPTLVGYHYLIPQIENRAEMLADPRMRSVTPSARELWDDGGHGFRRSFEPADIPRLEESLALQKRLVGALHEAGVPIVLGTGAGHPFVVPGMSVHEELRFLVECGLSPGEALRAGTRNAADALGRDDLGRVRVGTRGDLMLVTGEPWRDLAALQEIVGVFARGHWLPRADLELRAGEQVERYAREQPFVRALAKDGAKVAIELYEAALAEGEDPGLFREESLDRLCELVLIAGRERDAIELARFALDLYPEAWWAQLRYGQVMDFRGRPRVAIDHFNRSLELRPDGIEARTHTAEIGYRIARAFEDDIGARNWTRFRGPNGSGISAARTVPVAPTRQDYNWRVELPAGGHSSPVVWEGRVFVTGATVSEDEDERAKLHVTCLRTARGKPVWTRTFALEPPHKHENNSYASSTPAVDAERVYVTHVSAESLVVRALDHAGKDVWKREFDGYWALHGDGSSPIVVGDIVVVVNDGEGAHNFVVGLDRRTGETVWMRERPFVRACFSTPFAFCTDGGEPQILLASVGHSLTSLDPRTGASNWDVAAESVGGPSISSPVLAGDHVVATWGDNVCRAMRLPDGSAGSVPTEEFSLRRGLPIVPTPIAVGDLLFSLSESGIASCVRVPSGEELWRKRMRGDYFASPVYAGGALYVLNRSGELFVIAASESYEMLGSLHLGEASQATPAIAGGVMYLRTESHLISLGGKR